MNSSDALARLAAFGLPGADCAPITVDSLDDLVELAQARLALSWLSDAVAAGLVENVTPEFLQALSTRHMSALTTTMAAHAVAVKTVNRLREAGWTDLRVLKGCATGHLDYARPTDRFSSDVDLLVSTGDQAMLAQVFSVEKFPVPRRRRWQERYGKETAIVSEYGVELDLHVTIGDGYFGLVIPPDELRRHTESFEIAGTEMTAFDGPGRLLHAAIHIGYGHYNLNSTRDVLQLTLVTEVDWREPIDRATRWKVEGLMALGVRRAFNELVVEPHPILDWAERHHTHGLQRVALRLLGNRERGYYLTGVAALPVHRWPGYVVPLLLPSREYLREADLQLSARTKRLLKEVSTLVRRG